MVNMRNRKKKMGTWHTSSILERERIRYSITFCLLLFY